MLLNYYFFNESFVYGGYIVFLLKLDFMNEENIFLVVDMCIVI